MGYFRSNFRILGNCRSLVLGRSYVRIHFNRILIAVAVALSSASTLYAQEFFKPRQASLLWENDVASPISTDQWLTNNFRLQYQHNNAWGFALGNEMYTPKNIRSSEIPEGDRPWDGYTYAETSYRRGNAEKAQDFIARLGALGEASKTGRLQKFVHNDLNLGTRPSGWHTQNPSEVALELEYRKSFLSFHESLVGGVSLNPTYALRVGNVIDSASLGLDVRRGFFLPDWELTLRAGIRGSAVLWNTFLDGRVFHDEVYSVDSKWFVATGLAGISARYKKTKISYVYKYVTEEFEEQEGRHTYGSLEVTQEF
jgi:hypothetical protein